MSDSKYLNACAFMRSAVTDMASAVTTHLSSARLRLTGERSSMQFVWIMFDRIGDNIWAHTNDADYMVGYPPSLNISMPIADVEELVKQVIAFAEGEISNYGKVEALMQSDNIDRSQLMPSYVGDSESGYAAAHVVESHELF